MIPAAYFYVHPKTGDKKRAMLKTDRSVLLTMGYEELDPEQAQAMILEEALEHLDAAKEAIEAGDISLAAQEARQALSCLSHGGGDVFKEIRR